ncbi:uncharacterized protein G2W53_005118 [Senna tora]|uniref:Lysine ketoglutarate reductase trans-splicing related 1 n=1 Tax=Senna tora TaxID=362788 RepID=A0A835CJY4_9FABA|nr:uncharacterized protein G2W53_005118 [Senna tora]
MKAFNSTFVLAENRLCLFTFIVAVCLVCGAYFVGDIFVAKEYKGKLAQWGVIQTMQNTKSSGCKSQCRPSGSEWLPQGVVVKTSNLEMRPLWDSSVNNGISKPPLNLLAMAVGIKQKAIVNRIVEKFPSSDFVVMLFHYDGLVDGWRDLAWSDRAIHLSAINQTKWWFAKRFMHPDIVAEYNYIFLWDEDIGVENFDPKKYLSIVKEEGLEISQPALDPRKSEVHHPLTVRRRGSKVHRRYYKLKGSGRCDDHSTSPPCIGWVEMMAPVFSKKSWQCVWHMIQNDLIHAWGLDRQLGYCAQGDRIKNVGVVDSEYIVHLGLPTLGGSNVNEVTSNAPAHPPSSLKVMAPPSNPHGDSSRAKVRMQSFIEMQIFGQRWKDAVKNDKCWIDPYEKQANQTIQ